MGLYFINQNIYNIYLIIILFIFDQLMSCTPKNRGGSPIDGSDSKFKPRKKTHKKVCLEELEAVRRKIDFEIFGAEIRRSSNFIVQRTHKRKISDLRWLFFILI